MCCVFGNTPGVEAAQILRTFANFCPAKVNLVDVETSPELGKRNLEFRFHLNLNTIVGFTTIDLCGKCAETPTAAQNLRTFANLAQPFELMYCLSLSNQQSNNLNL